MIDDSKAVLSTGVCIVSLDHTFSWVDESFASITGHSPAELIGRTLESITHLDDVELDRSLADRMFGGHVDHYSMDKRYLHKTGETVPVRLNVSLLQAPGGAILYSIGVVQRIVAGNQLKVRASVPLTSEEEQLDRIRKAVIG